VHADAFLGRTGGDSLSIPLKKEFLRAHVLCWIARGRLKENVDPRWDNLLKSAGLGIIVRDHLGQSMIFTWKLI
jgi:hypothetical protein